MMKKIYLSKRDADFLNEILSMTGDQIYDKHGYKRDETFTYTAKFPDGCYMDVKLVICEGEDTPYCEAVLFNPDGYEIAFTEPEYELLGEWTIKTEEKTYTVVLLEQGQDKEDSEAA